MSAQNQPPRESGGVFFCLLGVCVAGYCYVQSGGNYHLDRRLGRPHKVTKSVVQREIDRIADHRGIPRALAHALARVESSYNHRAESHCGARGVTQVMPFNARRCGLRPEQLWDPTLNIHCGMQILSEEIDRVGNVRDALTVYNCGKVKCKEGQQYANKVLELAKQLG